MKTQIIKNKTQILNNQLVIVDKDLNSFYVRNLYIVYEDNHKISFSAGMLNSQNLTGQAMLVEFLLKNTKGKVFADIKKNEANIYISKNNLKIKKSLGNYMRFFTKKNNKRLGITA